MTTIGLLTLLALAACTAAQTCPALELECSVPDLPNPLPPNLGTDATKNPCTCSAGVGYCVVNAANPSPGSQTLDLSGAQSYCNSYGLNLVSIEDAAEEALILGLLNNIGFPASPPAQFWTSGTSSALAPFVWTWADDNTPFTYTNWCAGSPNIENNPGIWTPPVYVFYDWQRKCWSDAPDQPSATKYFVCETSPTTTCAVKRSTAQLNCTVSDNNWCGNSNNPAPSRTCPSDIGPDTTCSKILPLTGCFCFNFNLKNWDDSEAFCQANNMTLVSLQTNFKANLVTQSIEGGGFDRGFWTSGYNDNSGLGTWYWKDGQPFSYSNWCPNQPANTGWDMDRAYVTKTQCWADGTGTSTKFSICESP